MNEFEHDLPDLVSRTFQELTPSERRLLRTVTLLDGFSPELATAAADMRSDAPARRLVERAFVEHDPTAPWPYHLRPRVRSAIRRAEAAGEDRWSHADWRRAARRVLSALGAEYAALDGAAERGRLVGCLFQGLRLAHDFDLELGWLADAAYSYVSDVTREPDTVESETSGAAETATLPLTTPAAALVETLTAVSQRRRHRGTTLERLRGVRESGLLPAELDELPRYFIAECERDLGDPDASLRGMRAVADGGGRLAVDAARGLTHLNRCLGRFPDVLEAAERLGPNGGRHRVLGDLWWTQGRIERACASYARGRDDALQRRLPEEAALAQACLAFAAAFQDRDSAHERIERAEEMLAGHRNRVAELRLADARLLVDAGHDPDLPQRVDHVTGEADAAGVASAAAYARFVACFHAAVDFPDLAEPARARLAERVHGAEFAHLLELAHLMSGHEPPEELPRAHWLDGAEETAARWHRLVIDRRRELPPA